jgi:Ferritin-like domain
MYVLRICTLASCVISAVFAAPVYRRQYNSTVGSLRAITDNVILNYALTLEYLEAAFYNEGLQNFTEADFESAGYPPSVRDQIVEFADTEEAHARFLASKIPPWTADLCRCVGRRECHCG